MDEHGVEDDLDAISASVRAKLNAPLPPLTDAQWACNIGDLLEVIAPLDLLGVEEGQAGDAVQPSGQIYRAVSLVSRGWDLRLVSGNGPEEIRIMNGYVADYFRVLPS